MDGVAALHGADYRVMPDRIEAGTYAIAAAIAGGEVELVGAKAETIAALLGLLESAGADVQETGRGVKVHMNGSRPRSANVTTAPYPGFPTDLQAQIMALMAVADGTSVIKETIFENRFMQVPELARMGADVRVDGDRPARLGQPGARRAGGGRRNHCRAGLSPGPRLRPAGGKARPGRRGHCADSGMSARPLKLAAQDAEDLEILSARLQDAAAKLKDLVWLPRKRRFAAVFNRFQWEAKQNTRVRAGLHFDGVLKVQSQNIKLGAGEAVVALLAIRFTPNSAEDPGGIIELTFAGGGAIRLTVEMIDGELTDLTEPWAARGVPDHEAL